MSSAEVEPEENNPEIILGNYKQMNSECQQYFSKIQELTMSKDEHRLAVETLKKLEPERKAFRLISGILVESTVADVLPKVNENFEGVKRLFNLY